MALMKAKLICFVVAESPKPKKGRQEALLTQPLKSAPHYFEATVPRQFLISQDKLVTRGLEGSIMLKSYQPNFLLAEATFDMENIFLTI